MRLLEFLAIGAAAGWFAGRVMKGRGFGLAGDIVVGCLGSVIGGFLFGLLELSAYGTVGSFITAWVGAMALIWGLGVLKAKRV